MVALLSRMRKEMNGAVADTMFCYGKAYGLNYGVSLPTIRTIAQEIGHDNSLAQYLFQQQVRELQLAAMHIAKPEEITIEEMEHWGEVIVNSELAEEFAFAIMRHHTQLEEIFHNWALCQSEFKVYAALLSVAKSELASQKSCLESIPHIISNYPSSRPIMQGIVTLLDRAYSHSEMKDSVKELISQMGESPAELYIKEEMEWRMEY